VIRIFESKGPDGGRGAKRLTKGTSGGGTDKGQKEKGKRKKEKGKRKRGGPRPEA
jgi:hypothetical protein